jgi:hypothetical protein
MELLRSRMKMGLSVGRVVTPYLALAITVLLLLSLSQSIQRADDAENFAKDLRDSQVDACRYSNRTIRQVMRVMLRDENRRTRALDPGLFPNIPREEFRRLANEAIRDRNEQIQRLRDVPCDDVYPDVAYSGWPLTPFASSP